MKKSRKIIIPLFIVILFTVLFFPRNNDAAIISVKLLTWDLVDSSKHLDWGGSSAYLSSFTSGVSVWNSYKPGVIRKDTLSTIQDVTISDYYEVSSTAGVASSAGTIKFNKYRMNGYNAAKRKNVAMHEIGHVLRLAHNINGDVMYEYVSTQTTLTVNDKASYDAAYRKY